MVSSGVAGCGRDGAETTGAGVGHSHLRSSPRLASGLWGIGVNVICKGSVVVGGIFQPCRGKGGMVVTEQ